MQYDIIKQMHKKEYFSADKIEYAEKITFL